ncbi:MAG: hypothetical protein WCX71_03080 [Candidatus Buchananbacteria bacterium]
MIIYIISLIIILVSLGVIIYLVVKNFPRLASINVKSMPREKENQVKNRIMAQRLQRKFSQTKNFLVKVAGPLGEAIANFFSDSYRKILELEKVHTQAPLKKIDINQEIGDKLKEVEQLIDTQEWDQAEDVCISIVELNPRNAEVYDFLAKIYLEKREYKKAREVAKYLLKLLLKGSNEPNDKHRLANCYSQLGWIYELEGKAAQALANYQKAVGLEPSNPRFLDLLLKISIILKNKDLANKVFNDLRQADPDNQKLADIKEEIKNLPDEVEKQ